MRKTTKLFVTLALLVVGAVGAQATKLYADYSQIQSWHVAGNAQWDATTTTLTWIGSSNNLVTLPDLKGDFSSYTKIVLETSDLKKTDESDTGSLFFRLVINDENGNQKAKSMYSTGKKELLLNDADFSGLDFTKIKQVRIAGGQGALGSVVISKIYLVKPMEFSFDANGVGKVDLTDIEASGCFTFDDQTGVLTNNYAEDNTNGAFTIKFDPAVDMSNVYGFKVTYSGNQVLHNININGDFKFGSKFAGRTDIASAMEPYTSVTSWSWAPNPSTTGEMTITSVEFYSNVFMVSMAGEIVLSTLQYHIFPDGSNATAAWNVGKSTDTYYGSGSSDANYYVDLTDYAELRIYRDDNTGFRAFFINAAGTGTNNINNSSSCVTWVDSDKYFAIDLTQVEKYDGKVYLNTIKSSSYGTNNIVNNIVAYNAPATNAPKYIISGSGVLTAPVQAALADVAATAIDATGVTKAVELPTANPNCLIVAQEGMVTNGQNVIVDGTCANLVLTDGYAFAAPVGFTATEAKYGTTINASAGVGTLVLPFDAELPSGVTAFTLSYTSGASEATATEIEKLTANTPVLLNGSGKAEFMAAGVSIAATADEAVKAGALNGVYAATEISTGYVLQNGSQGAGFYKVNAEKPIEVKPFRAYLTADGGAARIAIVYDSESTGISSMYNEQCTMNEEVYDLQGRRMVREARGVYVKNGKKYVVK